MDPKRSRKHLFLMETDGTRGFFNLRSLCSATSSTWLFWMLVVTFGPAKSFDAVILRSFFCLPRRVAPCCAGRSAGDTRRRKRGAAEFFVRLLFYSLHRRFNNGNDSAPPSTCSGQGKRELASNAYQVAKEPPPQKQPGITNTKHLSRTQLKIQNFYGRLGGFLIRLGITDTVSIYRDFRPRSSVG